MVNAYECPEDEDPEVFRWREAILNGRIGELEKTIQMKDNLIGFQRKTINQQRELLEQGRGLDSYFEHERRILEPMDQPAAIIGNIIGNIPEKNKYYVVLYINPRFTEELGWRLKEVYGRKYSDFVEGKPEEIIEVLKGEIKGEMRIRIKDMKGKYKPWIVKKVDIPYEETPEGKKLALTLVYLHHAGLRTKKGIKTLEQLKREHEKAEERAEVKRQVDYEIGKAAGLMPRKPNSSFFWDKICNSKLS